jgi:trimethylamine---corrinoid protein Co-methyltransferase
MNQLRIQLMSEDEKGLVHRAALEILEETGMVIMEPEALDLLAQAGARVDFEQQRVRFPAQLVEQALRAAPKEVRLYGRDTQRCVCLKQDQVYYSTSGYAVQVHDPRTHSRRAVSQADLAWTTQIADDLDQVDIYAVLATPGDAPSATNDRYQLAIALANSTRPIWNTAYGKAGVLDAVQMLSLVRGSREALRQYPLMALDLTTLSALQLDERQASTMIEGARQMLPIGISPGPIGGATAPVTLGSIIVQANAEFLGALTLCQIVQPGVPVIYTQWTRVLDMASSGVTMGGPEFSLLRIANAEMAQYYDLPSRGGGLIADGKAPDEQLGAEKMLNCLTASLAGLNVVAGVGQTDFINTIRVDQMFIDNEIIRIVKHMRRGITVSPETIALDEIKAVGPRGNFLATDHTRTHYRQELWFPRLWDRHPWSVWEADGAKDVAQRAAEKLAAFQPKVPPLDPATDKAMWEVVRQADRQYPS